ncbi:hypothetical protein LBR04_18480 [Levilactobacillus brevis]|uniref:hypothetical protein n=1 Tax=Levilactobacillus brevis TaxID=1580 RepID=UPI00114508F2|nr:hypothetical protein [Levilactobacillus brevis]GEB75109.1 hypothetical protein LBR04_18480 [Levilactobacillus brevis]
MASNDEQRSATTILTTAAQSIAARLIANETTAKFTKAEISTTNLFNQSVTELQVLTSLDNVQQTADINTVTVINNNTVNVNVAIDQTKAPNNYQMNSVGLFAVDGDGKEVLYSVTVLKDPVYIHQDAMGSALGIDLETVVGQASNVEISVNPAGAVTNEILKATLADYIKADDSTVVHTADMRKPASDVAGIEEVNAKQDKLTITPADDSKVVHDNHDNTITANGASYDLSKSGLQPIEYVADGSFNDLPLGTVFANASVMTDGPDRIHGFTTKTFYSSQWGGRKVQIAIVDITNLMFFRTFKDNSDLWNSWTKLADDSKVAHLSGANNFDTVPTVNNNPLLLASSLPSDLARLSQDANFTGKLQQNGQDVALANNTIARDPNTGKATDTTDFPYKGLTVDGYPIIPLVLVPDRATAITKTAQYPNYAFMYGKELS